MGSSNNNSALLVQAARMYYKQNLSQQQISEKLQLSRPVVSRLLSQARQEGIVRIEIVDPADAYGRLAQALKKSYGLREAVVIPNEGISDADLKLKLGKAAAEYLDGMIAAGMILGVSWGSTMQTMAEQVKSRASRDLTVVQLVGGFTGGYYNTHASEITQKIADSLQAKAFLLPLPAIVETASVKKAILSDRNLSRAVEMGRKCDAAVFSLGSFSPESILVKTRYFNAADVKALQNIGAVGDICTHVIKSDGAVCSRELEGRTLGIELSDLSGKQKSIAVAGGKEKWAVIKAGLIGGYFNVLITDEHTAQEMLSA